MRPHLYSCSGEATSVRQSPRSAVRPRRVSFVVPAHNEEALIGRTLASIGAAAEAVGCAFEIVVADDASTDATADLARTHGARVVRVERRQIAAVRNAGARVTQGDPLIFVDADTLLPAATLAAALAALDDGAVGGGATVRLDEPVPAYARVALALLMFAFRRLRLAAGCFLFVRRAAFEHAGGFDETLFASEELALSRALKRDGAFVVLRESVLTSGRKARHYSFRSMCAMLAGQLRKGPRRAFRSREGLEFWYEAPREERPAERRQPQR